MRQTNATHLLHLYVKFTMDPFSFEDLHPEEESRQQTKKVLHFGPSDEGLSWR